MLVAVAAAGLAGCASVYNLPGNMPLGAALADNIVASDIPAYDDDALLALSFSGGGTRAAAFSFGVLQELERARSGSAGAKTLLDRVDFVSGVSGGSVTAAYFGLKRRAALDDFRERFLLRNAEEGLKTQISLGNIGRALEQVGASVADVVRTRMYVTDIEHWQAVGRAHGEVFGDIRPACTLLAVKALVDPAMLVEIEAEAILPE